MNQHIRSTACLLLLVTTALASPPSIAEPSGAEPGQTTALELAERYGLASWQHVERIDFTFDVTVGDRHFNRPWSWNVAERTVTANFGSDDAVTFSLDDVPEERRADHQRFINDSYWLLFPLYVVWSDNTVTDHGETTTPIGSTPSRKLTVQYPTEGGYTPGDAYDLYIHPQTGWVTEWAFRKGGGGDARPAVWSKPVGLNGLLITREFTGPEGSGFRLSFPVVQVHAHGSVAAAD